MIYYAIIRNPGEQEKRPGILTNTWRKKNLAVGVIASYNKPVRCASIHYGKGIRLSPGGRTRVSTILCLHLLFFLFLFLVLALVPRTYAQSPTDPSGLRLVGTVISAGFAGAVLGDAEGEQAFYPLSATLPDGSRIVKIRKNHILLRRNDGSLSEMYISQGASGASHQPPMPGVRASPSPVPGRMAAPAGASPRAMTRKAIPRRQRRSKRSSSGRD